MGFFQIIEWITAVVFPRTADEELIRSLDEAALERLITPRPLPYGVALLLYANPRIRALVHRAKYARDERAISLLGHALARFLRSRNHVALLIPIPLSRERQRERGFNQVELIIRAALTHSTLPHTIDTSSLIRTRHTAPQTHLARRERLSNLIGAFDTTPRAREILKNTHIILVDDVSTTGSTLAEARKTVLSSGAERVEVIAIAH